MFWFLLLGLLLPSNGAIPLPFRTADLIYNGTIDTNHTFPFQVVFYRRDLKQYFCGGTILNERFVLTAAHCIMQMSDFTTAYAGVLDMKALNDSAVQSSHVRNKTMHPDWDQHNIQNDIGMVELETPYEFTDFVAPINISRDDESTEIAGQAVVVEGFGAVDYHDGVGKDSQYLRYADVKIYDRTICQEVWIKEENTKITDTQICTTAKGKGILPGDSGGPLLYKEDDEWRQPLFIHYDRFDSFKWPTLIVTYITITWFILTYYTNLCLH
ncbi:hypothetical protein QR680_011699 [Steinernema hermaphroditum]|uniref:Peptidase S1 domain-containing protein n=1 Tax=Steinernema hermaphroditum TaxID=289476 RepID=A0AA39HZH0_9BILA|nr:hypothetical protein QR680_011699 [Steinernema hermaphroditum]